MRHRLSSLYTLLTSLFLDCVLRAHIRCQHLINPLLHGILPDRTLTKEEVPNTGGEEHSISKHTRKCLRVKFTADLG